MATKTQTVMTMSLLAAAGLASGCASGTGQVSSASAPVNTGAPVYRSPETSPAQTSADGTTTTFSSSSTPVQTTTIALPPSNSGSAPQAGSGTGSSWRPGQKLEPFWISMTAEADRAAWEAPMNGAAAANTSGPLTLTTTPNANFASGKPAANNVNTGDDAADGLTHVTFAPEGADFDPCVSKNGKFMVFASTQHRPTSDIYKQTIGGRTVTLLTGDAGNDVMPAISPDGSRIAFCSDRSGNWDIYIMSSDGGQAVQLTSDATHELHPSWSPDGSKLVFCRMGETSGRWEMWVVDAQTGSAPEFIGYGLFPQWCPVAGTGGQGRDKILFQRSRERGDRAFAIWTVDYKPGDTSSPTEIASGTGSAMINAAWSPDGTRIVYSSIDNANQLNASNAGQPGASRLPTANLWMTAVDGTQRVNLTSGKFMNLMPCWAGDGRIYFVSDRSGTPNIWSMGTDKAVQAATGNRPGNPSRMETAQSPAKTAPAVEPVAIHMGPNVTPAAHGLAHTPNNQAKPATPPTPATPATSAAAPTAPAPATAEATNPAQGHEEHSKADAGHEEGGEQATAPTGNDSPNHHE